MLLENPAPVEDYIEWMDDIVERRVLQVKQSTKYTNHNIKLCSTSGPKCSRTNTSHQYSYSKLSKLNFLVELC